MKCYCIQCKTWFESAVRTQEFCSTPCRTGFYKAEQEHQRKVREVAREGKGCMLGARWVGGGRQAIDFGLSDYRNY